MGRITFDLDGLELEYLQVVEGDEADSIDVEMRGTIRELSDEQVSLAAGKRLEPISIDCRVITLEPDDTPPPVTDS